MKALRPLHNFFMKVTVRRSFSFACLCTFAITTLTLFSARCGSSATSTHIYEDQIFVAIVACSKSLESWRSPADSSLYSLFIPSLEKTITHDEVVKFRSEVIISYDEGDSFWEQRKHRTKVIGASKKIPVNFLSVKKEKQNRVPFNEVTRVAFEYGAEYIVRVNDDTEFLTPGWLSAGVQELRRMCPQNIGVVGPTCNDGNTRILTHDMVHKTHIEIFKNYYPPEFDNWWVDDWISMVYGPTRTLRLRQWGVKHHTAAHGQRYTTDQSQASKLTSLVQEGRKVLSDHLLSTKCVTPDLNVLNSPKIRITGGPLEEFASRIEPIDLEAEHLSSASR